MTMTGEHLAPRGESTSASTPIERAKRNITDWLDGQLGQVAVPDWPMSVRYWFYRIDAEARLGLECPTSVIGFMAKALAKRPGMAWSGRYAHDQGAPERDGYSFAEYMGRAPTCSDAFFQTQAVAWYAARLDRVPEQKWTLDVLAWAESLGREEIDGAPPPVLGWLGQVLVDPGIPSDLYEPLGNVIRTF